jgi:ubiquinone/menaquinone biosynthesis C-methylase UbiE
MNRQTVTRRGMYDPFAATYDLEYGHKDDDIAFYLDAADRYGAPVLEIGVGTGRIALELAAKGHSVWGVDNSAAMLKVAAAKAARLSRPIQQRLVLRQADMRCLQLRKKFPTVLVPFRAFLHNLTQADQLAALASFSRHLQPKGMLLFDLFVPLYQVFSKTEWHMEIPEKDLARASSGLSITARVHHDPVNQLLAIENVYHQHGRDRRAKMAYRYVFRYEMEALLTAAGFEVVSCFSGFDASPYDFHSGVMVFCATKK